MSANRVLALDSARRYPEYDNHEFVVSLNDEAAGLQAYIAVHSSKLGQAHGGTRLKAYKNEAEALRDVLNLSRAMSYKSALAGLPYGGAKGVIILDPSDPNRKKVLQAYAERLDQLGGLFRTGTDVGLTDTDVVFMSRHSRYLLGLPGSNKAGLSTSKSAARGVFLAMKAALKYRYGTDKLQGRTVGVKGVGKLGGGLVELLVAEGAHVVIADVDEAKTAKLKAEHQSQITVVKPSEIHKQKLDVYAPCALGAEFEPSVVRELKCDIVVGGANNQLPNAKAGDDLFARGLLYAPDYIVNAGGLIFVSEDLESDGFHVERVARRLAAIPKTLTKIFETSKREHTPTYRVADRFAEERIKKGK